MKDLSWVTGPEHGSIDLELKEPEVFDRRRKQVVRVVNPIGTVRQDGSRVTYQTLFGVRTDTRVRVAENLEDAKHRLANWAVRRFGPTPFLQAWVWLTEFTNDMGPMPLY